METKRRSILLILLLFAAAVFIAGWMARAEIQSAKVTRKQESLAAFDVGGAKAPLWAAIETCRQATEAEKDQSRLALEVLQVFDSSKLDELQQAAVKYFGYPWRQRRGAADSDKLIPCPPTELYAAITEAAIKARVFERPFLYAKELALAEQLGPRHQQIIDATARSAFRDSEIPDDPFKTDLRPYARLILAGFGPSASEKWANQAFAQMSSNDQMGTGAAQVAVAGGEPQALPKVKDLMEQILLATPEQKPIPRLVRNRFYELAFALGMAGERSQPYAQPLIELLDRRVESWAPPFGMIELPPARMCPVARHIGGTVAAAAETKEFCVRRPKAFEQ